jgi:TPR repeat protein
MNRFVAFALAVLWSATAHSTDGAAARELGLAEYEACRFNAAIIHFRRAAELEDARSAEILALMYRHGERLYGDQVRADAGEAARWATRAAELRARTLGTTTGLSQ